MTRRRAFIAGIAAIVMARRAGAQPTTKVARLGVLGVGRQLTDAQGFMASKLRELGWEEGRNLSIDYRFADSPDAMPQLAAILVASKPDVLVALGPFPAHALKDATQRIPIVFSAVADPVGRGLVASLARPGGNITGASHFVGPNFGGKPAELLKELVPRAQRMAWLINPANPIYRTGIVIERNIDQLSRLKLSLERIEARSAAELPAAFEAAARARADGLVMNPDAVFSAARDTIVKLAEKHKLPAVYPQRNYVEAGGLISYGANFVELYRRVAVHVDKILRGAKPADLPIEQPTTFEMVVNLKTAKALGLTIPPSVLLRADQVIQ